MLADFFTKPLQGALFISMREKVLNLPDREMLTCTGVCWKIEMKNCEKEKIQEERYHRETIKQDRKSNNKTQAKNAEKLQGNQKIISCMCY